MPSSNDHLIKCRKRLIRLDQKLIALLNERMGISKKVGKIKALKKINIQQEKFWKEASSKRKKAIAKTNLNSGFAEGIFTEIHKESLRIQKQVIIEIKK